MTSNAVLRFWRPDGVIVDGAALGRSGFSLADFKDIPIVYCAANDEILAVRVREAKRLLSDTDIPVSLVAEKCGYGNERSLRYIFAKATGVSPIEWRRNGVGS